MYSLFIVLQIISFINSYVKIKHSLLLVDIVQPLTKVISTSDGQTDRQTNGQTGGVTDGRTDIYRE